jgi:hypothetical protein
MKEEETFDLKDFHKFSLAEEDQSNERLNERLFRA